MRIKELYPINRKFKTGDGGIYNPKYLDDAIKSKDLLQSLMIAHNNIEILLRYIYIYGKIVNVDHVITEEDVIKVDKPQFASLNNLCKGIVRNGLFGDIKKFNELRTTIHTIIVNNQFKEKEEIYFVEIEKTKKICIGLSNVLFKTLQERYKQPQRTKEAVLW